MRVRRWPVIGVVLAVLWLFVRGVALEPATLLGELLIGLGVGVPIAYLLRQFYVPTIDIGHRVRATPALVAYATVFVRELLTANVEVAYRVLAPSLPINPGVVEVPLRVQSDMAITTIANSITLTPGTLTMDYDDDTNTLYVHAIDGRNPDAIVDPIRTWEDYALVIFDEEAEPTDPAPPRPRERTTEGTGDVAVETGVTPDGVDTGGGETDG